MYTHTWNKYLPVIRILLKRSVNEEQKVGLNRIDFENGSRNRKFSCSFNVELEKGRLSKMSQSAPAKELIAVLLEDAVSKDLLRENTYVISLNSSFQLTIKNLAAIVQVEEKEAPENKSAKRIKNKVPALD